MAQDITRRYCVGTRDLFFKGANEWYGRANGSEEWQSWTPTSFMRSMFDDYTGREEPSPDTLRESDEYEVEDAVHLLAPMTVVDDASASGGKFVEVPLGTGENPDDLMLIDDTTHREKLANPENPMYRGQITMEVDVRRSRLYRIEALVKCPSNPHDALYFSSERSQHKHFFGWKPDKVTFTPSEQWQWAEIADSVFLRYGANRFLLAWWEDGVQIDKIRITNCGDGATSARNSPAPRHFSTNRLHGNSEALVRRLLTGRMPAGAVDGSMRVTLTDMRGRRVARIAVNRGRMMGGGMPGTLPSGIYVYRLDWETNGDRGITSGRIGPFER
jgi:hypothetical protein